jgi:hypothetical protein
MNQFEDLFDTLEATFRARLDKGTREVWAHRLSSLDRQGLRAAINSLCSTEDRLPSLARILQSYRGSLSF